MTAALSVIVVTLNQVELLDACLRTVETAIGHVPEGAELIVVDNGSDDGTAARVRASHPRASLMTLSRNHGFAGALPHAIAASQSRWIALVNDDAELEPQALTLLMAAAQSAPDIGAATAQVRFAARPDLINTAGLEIDVLGIGYDRCAGAPADDPSGEPQEVFGASGCVTLYRRSMLDQVGGFDATFFAYLEDTDLCWRARAAGWRTLYVPAAIAHHHGSATTHEGSARKYFLVGRNRLRMLAKNATTAQLLRHGWAMAAYDLLYVAFVAIAERQLAPLRGRIAGLREWRAYRSAGAATRGPAPLVRGGMRGALAMRRAYKHGATPDSGQT